MTVKLRPYRGQEGIYEVDIIITLPDGKEIRERKKSPCRGKEDSRRWANEREHELQQLARSGELKKIKEVPTVEAFWPKFMTLMVANKLEPSSIRVKTSQYKNWILPHLGSLRMDKIGAEEVAKFKAILHQSPLSPNTITPILIILRQMLAAAEERKFIKEPPKVRGPKPVEPKSKWVKTADFEELVQSAKQESPEALVLVLLAGEACLRIGEAMGLWWDAVDFGRQILHVKRNLHEGQLNDYTKNKKVRQFRATPRILEAIAALPRRRTDFVLVAPEGGPWHAAHANRVLAKVFARAEMGKMGPHAFRHCGASRMNKAGVPAAHMLKITGHKDLAILSRYLHVEDEETDLVIERLAELTPAVLGEVLEKGKGADVLHLPQKRRRRAQEGL